MNVVKNKKNIEIVAELSLSLFSSGGGLRPLYVCYIHFVDNGSTIKSIRFLVQSGLFYNKTIQQNEIPSDFNSFLAEIGLILLENGVIIDGSSDDIRFMIGFDAGKQIEFDEYGNKLLSIGLGNNVKNALEYIKNKYCKDDYINFPRPYGRGFSLLRTPFALNLFLLVT